MMWEQQYACAGPQRPTTSARFDTKGDSVSGVGGRHQLAKGQFAEVFPCEDPTNPQYSDYLERLRSFQTWTGYVSNPTPEQLAAAGLFYLGERDRCKCYYCNGGLQNWDFGDDPMTEHAKYFPQCEFVLQHKGPDFVAELNAKFPDLRRPGNVSNVSQVQQTVNHRQPARNNAANQQAQYRSPPAHVLQRDPDNVDDALPFDTYSPAQDVERELINQAVSFGFDRNEIESIAARKLQLCGTRFDSLADIIDELTKIESDDGVENMDVAESIIPPISRRNTEADDVKHQHDMKFQLESALEDSVCKSCFQRERSCVFMSCGHLCCCYECGKLTKQCPICKSKVLEAIRIYKT